VNINFLIPFTIKRSNLQFAAAATVVATHAIALSIIVRGRAPFSFSLFLSLVNNRILIASNDAGQLRR